VLVFARRQWIPQALMVKLFPFMVLPMSVLFFFRPGHMEWLVIPAHLLMFFTAAMICHGELVRRRPGARHLTQFYLLMSVGGVLGGLFNTMVAPAVFTRILEYPLVMALACLVLPRTGGAPDSARDRRRDLVLPIILAAVAAGGLLLIRTTILARVGWVPMVLGVGLLLACFTFKARPVRFGLSYVVLLLAILFLGEAQAGNTLYAERNFFGVKRVLLDPSGRLRLLAHGNTTHGCQLVDPSRSREPCSYYHRRGPIGEVFTAFSGQPGRQVGVIGLGSGAVAAYAGPGEHFTFYEIDPAIERIARDRRYFSYLADCRGTCDVVLGDGRLMAARAPDGGFDLFLVDAFNSDSVPTHLLAREAIEVYLRKLSPHGVLAFHVSNRFFDFEPLLARAGEEMGLACMAKFGPALTREELADGKQPARVVVMARRAEELKRLPAAHGWHSVPADKGVRVWTDQYCDVVGLLLRGRRLDLGPRAAVAGGR
jgi:SAM-dependent methyltransferase